jgi:hypothetical protein
MSKELDEYEPTFSRGKKKTKQDLKKKGFFCEKEPWRQ